MKRTVRKLINLTLVAVVVVSLVLTAFAPLLAPPPSVAQTNPQTTDIFTGQFIPAYYGAAYDPSEAYKQLAGATVYVFAYDTWGRVVNDFAYKTQVKANGSFQAAGLPNASHYGVYFPDGANSFKYFRSPNEDDKAAGLQSAFAYQQATYSSDSLPRTQANNQSVPESIKNAPVFTTSSRTVDIGNHVNVFPLVPTNVLSVIIKDSWSSPDFANFNRPYEIYAQRVASASTQGSSRATSCDQRNLEECKFEDADMRRQVTNGPVIRGRTVTYTPQTEDGSPCGMATIFQAFAPAGTYAITYWRPDGRDAQEQITYLNFNGTQPLNTPYNGIAVESVTSNSTWKELATRCVLDRTSSSNTTEPDNFWRTYPYSANIWGVTKTNDLTSGTVVAYGATVSILDKYYSFVDTTTRRCKSSDDENDPNYRDVIPSSGIYIFSSCGVGSSSIDSFLTFSGTLGDDDINEIGKPVRLGGEEGPSRFDVSITLEAQAGLSGTLNLAGKPVRNTWIDFITDNFTHRKVAKTDKYGRFTIGKNYLSAKPGGHYRIRVSSSLGSKAIREVAIDPMSLANLKSGNANLGIIALDKKVNPVESYLAQFSLPKLLSKLRIPSVLASYESQYSAPWTTNGSPFDRDNWVFYLNTETLKSYYGIEALSASDYSLEHAHISIPEEAIDLMTCDHDDETVQAECEARLDNAYEKSGAADLTDIIPNNDENRLFKINDDDSTTKADGAVLNAVKDRKGFVTEDDKGSKIIAISLKPEDDDLIVRQLMFFTTLLGPDPAEFRLTLKLNYEHDEENESPKASTDDTTLNGQADLSSKPKTLSADWPVYIWPYDDAGNFNVSYSKVVLQPGEYGSCQSAKLTKPSSWVPSYLCNALQGFITGIERVFGWMADHILILDPLSFSVVPQFWNVIRNLANSLAVFLLLLAGIAIMFRIEPQRFNIQSVLTRLIVAIILVNFSILVIQVAVDISNVVSYGGYRFLVSALNENNVPTQAGMGAATVGFVGLASAALALAFASGGLGWVLGIMLILLAVFLFFGYIIIRILIDWMGRLAVLWLCIILAPAAFAARVLPTTEKYFKSWKDALIGTLVAQVALAFIVAIAIGMLNQSAASNNFKNSLITFILAFILFWFATKAPRKAAAMAGSDVSTGLESLAKRGALMAGSKFMGASGFIAKQRKLGEARDVAFAGELEGRRGLNRLATRFRLTTGATIGDKLRNKELVDKKTEEAYGQAKDEKQAMLKRQNQPAYDFADEQHYADELTEMQTDLDKKLMRASDPRLAERLREEKHHDEVSSEGAEMASQAYKMSRPDLLESERVINAADKFAEAQGEVDLMQQRMDHPDAVNIGRTIKREEKVEGFAKNTFRAFAQLPLDDNRATLNMLRQVHPDTRLVDMKGRTIIDASNEDAFKAGMMSMFKDRVPADTRKTVANQVWNEVQAARTAGATIDFSTTGNTMDSIAALGGRAFVERTFNAAGVVTEGVSGETIDDAFYRNFTQGFGVVRDTGFTDTSAIAPAVAPVAADPGARARGTITRMVTLARSGRDIPSPLPPVSVPAGMPTYAPAAATWAAAAGFPPLPTPPANLPAGTDVTAVQNMITTINTINANVAAGVLPTPAERTAYAQAWRQLQRLGYTPAP